MSRRAPSQRSPQAASALELEQRIHAVESRMVQRRQSLQDSWVGLERQIDQVLSARTWLWPLLMGMAGGCIFGLLWRRGGCAQERPAAGRGAAWMPGRWRVSESRQGREEREGREGRGGQSPGSWLHLLLQPLLQQWLRPALVQATEGVLRALLLSLLREPGVGPGRRRQGPEP